MAILPQCLVTEPPFVRKGCDGNPEIAIYIILPQFLAIEPHFVQTRCAGRLVNRNFTSVFGDRTSFRAKVFTGNTKIAILPQFLAIEPHFVRKGCVSCVSLALPRAFKREIEKKERARGQEEKM